MEGVVGPESRVESRESRIAWLQIENRKSKIENGSGRAFPVTFLNAGPAQARLFSLHDLRIVDGRSHLLHPWTAGPALAGGEGGRRIGAAPQAAVGGGRTGSRPSSSGASSRVPDLTRCRGQARNRPAGEPRHRRPNVRGGPGKHGSADAQKRCGVLARGGHRCGSAHGPWAPGRGAAAAQGHGFQRGPFHRGLSVRHEHRHFRPGFA